MTLRLTGSQLESVLRHTKLDERARQACRRVIAEGEGVRATAREIGVSPAFVSASVKRVEATFKRLFLVPFDWDMVTVTLPPDQAKALKELERKLWKEHGLGVPP